MTVMTPRLLAPKTGWAYRYPRPEDAVADGDPHGDAHGAADGTDATATRATPWAIYLLLAAVSLLMWYVLGELAMLMWRLPYP